MAFKDLNDNAGELKGLLGEINAAMNEFAQQAEEASNKSKAIEDGFKTTKDSLAGIVDVAQQLNKAQNSSKNLSEDQAKNLQNQLSTNKNNLKLSQESLANQIKINQKHLQKLKNLKNQEGNAARLRDLIIEQIVAYEQADAVIKDMDGDVDNLGKSLEKALSVAKGQAHLDKIGSTLNQINNPINQIAPGLSSWLSPLGLINNLMSLIIGNAMEVDKQLGASAKSMNMTYEEAGKMRMEMAASAEASGDMFLNSKNTEKAVIGLNAALGTTVKFSDMSDALQEDVELMGKLANYAGLTAKETESIQKMSLGAGKSAEKNTKELMASYKVQGLNNKMLLNEKDALKAISNTNKAIQVSMGGSGKELGKALASAKGLGVELNKVDGIAGSLLNFEKSITSELEAELLTGKELNLETARQAALNGDLATVAEEIANQVGSAADFAKMNRIQQEAMAEAVGMSREELAGALQEQEALKAIGAESVDKAKEKFDTMVAEHGMAYAMKELGDEELAKQFEQQSIDEQRQAAQDKMMDGLANSIIPSLITINQSFSNMFNKVKEIFDKFGGWKTILTAIGVIMTAKLIKGTVDFAKSVGDGVKMLKNLKLASLKDAIVNITSAAMKTFGGIPLAGFGLAAAAAAGGIALLNSQSADDAMFPAAGGSGYGKRTMFGPEGAIQFNNKDTIVAGTDLFADDAVAEPGKATQMMKEGEVKASSGGGGGNMSAVVNAINALGARVDALASRPINVGIDGNKVIEATTGANPKTDGDEMAKNSFKTQ